MTDGLLKYILDANVFMEASRRYYSIDFAKPFWDALTKYAERGIVCSIDKVYDEIKKGDDALKKWAEKDFSNYFLPSKQTDILIAYANIVQWVQREPQYIQRAKDVFMEDKNADSWVLAFAAARDLKIVTHEVFAADAQKRIPIPNVCQAFSIDYCDTFEMLKEMKFKF